MYEEIKCLELTYLLDAIVHLYKTRDAGSTLKEFRKKEDWEKI